MRIQFRSVNDGREEEFSRLSGVDAGGESMTVQSMVEDADINVIVRRFGVTGQLPTSFRVPQYGDFTEVGDFRSAWEAVRKAEENFMQLPAEVRARFGNDPQQLLEFVSNDANMDAAKALGLVVEKPDVGVTGVAGGSNSSAGANAPASGAAGGANAPSAGSGAGSGKPAGAAAA